MNLSAVVTDVEYAIRQLAKVSCKVPNEHYDPVRRALDALERVRDALTELEAEVRAVKEEK